MEQENLKSGALMHPTVEEQLSYLINNVLSDKQLEQFERWLSEGHQYDIILDINRHFTDEDTSVCKHDSCWYTVGVFGDLCKYDIEVAANGTHTVSAWDNNDGAHFMTLEWSEHEWFRLVQQMYKERNN